MAEALALISSLTAIMQLTSYMVKSTKDLIHCVKIIRDAPKEIEHFILESSIFTEQLRLFYDLAKNSANGLEEKVKAKRARLVRKIVKQCKSVKRDFASLVKCFIEINGTDTVPYNKLLSRILWLWKRPDIPELRLSLQSAIANVMLLCNLFTWEDLIRKNESNEKIEMLQEQLQNLVSTARKLRRELANHQRRKLPPQWVPETIPDKPYEDITEDTRELERYVVNMIRSHARESGLPPRSSRQESSSPIEEARVPASSIRSETIPTESASILRPRAGEINVPHAFLAEEASSHATASSVQEERGLSRTWIDESSSAASRRRFHERTFGSRVRDNGHGVYIDVGEWPEEVQNVDTGSTEAVEIANTE